MINYSYEITSLSCSQLDATKPDLVTCVQVMITGTDDADQLSSKVATTVQLQASDTFTPFDQLTEEIVTTWILTDPSIEFCKQNIAVMIADIRNPPYIERPAPWYVSPIQLPEPVSPAQTPPLVFATIGNISL